MLSLLRHYIRVYSINWAPSSPGTDWINTSPSVPRRSTEPPRSCCCCCWIKWMSTIIYSLYTTDLKIKGAEKSAPFPLLAVGKQTTNEGKGRRRLWTVGNNQPRGTSDLSKRRRRFKELIKEKESDCFSCLRDDRLVKMDMKSSNHSI